jgi:hypothetical protein
LTRGDLGDLTRGDLGDLTRGDLGDLTRGDLGDDLVRGGLGDLARGLETGLGGLVGEEGAGLVGARAAPVGGGA